MHVPTHFAMTDGDVRTVLAGRWVGELVTWSSDGGLQSTTVPFVHEPVEGGWGSLHGHLARANPQWREPAEAAMVLLRGPDGYVSPSWYPSKAQDPRVVPTWDYVAVHAHGELVAHDDVERSRWVVERLTEVHEAGREQPWRVDDAPAEHVDRMLRAVVAVELRITGVVGKAKLSQNRSAQDVDGVVAALRADGHVDLAEAVARANPGVGR